MFPPQAGMYRIVVIGSTGAGKTTLAKQLAKSLNLHHIELDSLFWGPGWSESPKSKFANNLKSQMAPGRWVADGNYSFARDLIWPFADTAVWLDYPLPIIFWRLFLRTLRRTIGREQLWNGNRERFINQFFSRESLFLYAIKSKKKHCLRYPNLLNRPEYQHIFLIHHNHPNQTTCWLNSLINR